MAIIIFPGFSQLCIPDINTSGIVGATNLLSRLTLTCRNRKPTWLTETACPHSRTKSMTKWKSPQQWKIPTMPNSRREC